jgi:hypothetical protein
MASLVEKKGCGSVYHWIGKAGALKQTHVPISTTCARMAAPALFANYCMALLLLCIVHHLVLTS